MLLNEEMVRATLVGTKTQTRRPMKPQPEHDARYEYQPQRLVYKARSGWEGVMWDPWQLGHPRPGYEHVAKMGPYGVPGDVLYVRETFAVRYTPNQGPPWDSWTGEQVLYRASGDESSRWYPSIHMPKEYSRLWLLNTGVRVERIQSITEEDAFAEGINTGTPYECGDAVDCFRALWDSIYNKKGLGWDTNPWCWVTCYEVTER
uniref:Uncharacterized protein n=2 Tax=viral metagenome TaxID=1070528 RepID=A0A6H1ZD64_9ZZZZ